MDGFNKTVGILGAIISFAGFFFPDLHWYLRLIIFLSTCSICFIILYFYQMRKISALNKELGNVTNNHKALGKLFENNLNLIQQYRDGFKNVYISLLLAQQNTNATKISKLVENFLQVKSQIKDEGVNHE